MWWWVKVFILPLIISDCLNLFTLPVKHSVLHTPIPTIRSETNSRTHMLGNNEWSQTHVTQTLKHGISRVLGSTLCQIQKAQRKLEINVQLVVHLSQVGPLNPLSFTEVSTVSLSDPWHGWRTWVTALISGHKQWNATWTKSQSLTTNGAAFVVPFWGFSVTGFIAVECFLKM